VPTDDDALLRGGLAHPRGERGFVALSEQGDLEVVAHASVDGGEGAGVPLDRRDRVQGGRGGVDHAASGFDDDLGVVRQVRAGGADEGVEVVRDARGLVAVRVTRAESTAEVVDRESPSAARGSTAAARSAGSMICDPTCPCTPRTRTRSLRPMRSISARAAGAVSPNLDPTCPVATWG